MIVDPGLYMARKQDIFYVEQQRELPTAFKLFTGSAWVALSRDFAEYVVWGWDNLPRTLLMYYANFVSSPEGYFQTVLCNAPRFVPTAANHDLHHIQWDTPPRQHPHPLALADRPAMERSGALRPQVPRDDPCSTPSTPTCSAAAARQWQWHGGRRQATCSSGAGGASAPAAGATRSATTGCSGRAPAPRGWTSSWTGSSGRRPSSTASASS